MLSNNPDGIQFNWESCYQTFNIYLQHQIKIRECRDSMIIMNDFQHNVAQEHIEMKKIRMNNAKHLQLQTPLLKQVDQEVGMCTMQQVTQLIDCHFLSQKYKLKFPFVEINFYSHLDSASEFMKHISYSYDLRKPDDCLGFIIDMQENELDRQWHEVFGKELELLQEEFNLFNYDFDSYENKKYDDYCKKYREHHFNDYCIEKEQRLHHISNGIIATYQEMIDNNRLRSNPAFLQQKKNQG